MPAETGTRPAADTEALAAEFDNLFRISGIGDKNGRAQVIFRGLVKRAGLTAGEARLLEKSFRFFGSRIQKKSHVTTPRYLKRRSRQRIMAINVRSEATYRH